MINKNISIIIPTYGKLNYLTKCINSIKKQTILPSEIIIIDNGSNINIDNIKNTTNTKILLIKLHKNEGFSKACNEAIKYAKNDLIAIVNNDTILDKNWLKYLVLEAIKNPSFSVFTPKILRLNSKKIIESAGDEISNDFKFQHRYGGKFDKRDYNNKEEVFLVPATAALYRKSFFQKVGYFDEDFFLYFEDVDIAFRGQLMGQRYMYIPKSIAYHKGKATSSIIKKDIGYFEFRNSIIVWIKCLPKETINNNVLMKIINNYKKIMLINFNVKKLLLLAKTLFYLLINIRILIRKREFIQKNIKVDKKYLSFITALDHHD